MPRFLGESDIIYGIELDIESARKLYEKFGIEVKSLFNQQYELNEILEKDKKFKDVLIHVIPRWHYSENEDDLTVVLGEKKILEADAYDSSTPLKLKEINAECKKVKHKMNKIRRRFNYEKPRLLLVTSCRI